MFSIYQRRAAFYVMLFANTVRNTVIKYWATLIIHIKAGLLQ